MIYLDHAATSPLRREAKQAMDEFSAGDNYANPSAGHSMGRKANAALNDSRRVIAELLDADPSELYFTSGGTESDNWALLGTAAAAPEKKQIIASSIEHHAILHTLEFLKRFGYSADLIEPDSRGVITPEAVCRHLSDETLLVSVMMANNEIGTVEPVREIASAVHRAGAFMHTDAVQAVGQIPVHIHGLGVDMLSFSGHKFGSPKGIGMLYIRKGTRIVPFHNGGAQERGLRGGTENVCGAVGMAAALQAALSDDSARLARLRDRLAERILSQTDGCRINGSAENKTRLPGNLHLSFENVDQDALMIRLDMAGIMASAGSACTSGVHERSHVLRAIGAGEKAEADLRLTLGFENTEDEMNLAADRITQIVRSLRSNS